MFAHSSRTMAGAKRLAETRRPDRSREEVTVRVIYPRRPKTVQTPAEPPRPQPRISGPMHARMVISRVAAWHDLMPDEIVASTRSRRIVEARMDAIAAVYANCTVGRSEDDGTITRRPMSLPELGRIFGNRDHTTILHSLRKRGFHKIRKNAGGEQ